MSEGRLEHRRIDTSSGSVPVDPDWASLNTAPMFGDDLEAGEVRPFQMRAGKPVFWLKAYDGLGDDAEPVPSSTASLTVEVVSFHENRGKMVPCVGQELTVGVNQRLTERDLALDGRSVLRVKGGTVDGGDLAIWIFASISSTEY